MSTAEKLNYTMTNVNKLKVLTQKTVLSEVVSNIEQNYGSGGNVDEYFDTTMTLQNTCSYIFNRLIKKIPFDLDTSNVNDMSNMFYGCENLIELDLSNVNTSNVTKMKSMFSGCTKLTSIFGILDMKNVTDITSMFSVCTKLKTVYIKNLNASGLSLNLCPLTHESLVYLINNLVDATGSTTKILNLKASNLAKLTEEEKAIAIHKNWTLT